MENSKEFWQKQSSSHNRSADPEFYRRKAAEHAALLDPVEREAGCIDLGCGAGEMLRFFADDVNVKVGLDYSDAMLVAARAALGDRDIELTAADAFAYLPATAIPVWTTTGALNQYLSIEKLKDLMHIFADNPSSRSFFLFDCIDPMRFRAMPLGISYRENHAYAHDNPTIRRKIKQLMLRVQYGTQLLFGRFDRDIHWLGNASMGYGIRPGFWHRIGKELDLGIEIVSSRYYEYRYHVLVRKKD